MHRSDAPQNPFPRMPLGGTGSHPPEVRPSPPTQEEILQARVEQMPRDVGAMLLTVGFAGFVLPGIVGLPFLLAGGVILMPKTTQKLKKKLGMEDDSPHNEFAARQINRFLDDLDRRYPQAETES
ncbi:MAG: hypothetical protein RLZZ226_1284 [Pseudomonadota bacterium]